MGTTVALGLTLVACKDLAFGYGTPGLTGVWLGSLPDGARLTLVLQNDKDSVVGSGSLLRADTSVALEIRSGLYIYPNLSLVIESDPGLFSLVGSRSARTEPLRFGVDVVTITGEFAGPWYVGLPVVLTRQDSVFVGGS